MNGGEEPRTVDGVSPRACFPSTVLAARIKHTSDVCIIDRADIIRPNGVCDCLGRSCICPLSRGFQSHHRHPHPPWPRFGFPPVFRAPLQLQRDIVDNSVMQQNTAWWLLGESRSPSPSTDAEGGGGDGGAARSAASHAGRLAGMHGFSEEEVGGQRLLGGGCQHSCCTCRKVEPRQRPLPGTFGAMFPSAIVDCWVSFPVANRVTTEAWLILSSVALRVGPSSLRHGMQLVISDVIKIYRHFAPRLPCAFQAPRHH